ncbi:MAG: nicotinate-nucleotide adenylyltransferase [Acetomicrobium sp.]|uniref:Probable nicotinate-nucleotide adenylyltransferase n=2 Tax=Acetomicrobiaceae TaxID=3029086 RepID=A0A1H3ENY8_9BACT|nr:nicotinate-nucleotide adenylyltransferase [Acetomicrobium sp.]SDX80340.1 nicotinate-nucleotide adenylyltransferase [Acetomicrobium thermoterrenum DSM 13490]
MIDEERGDMVLPQRRSNFMSRLKVGIMGGTFDPIHFGHLVIAEEAYISLNLSEVIFVPTGNPPHKNNKMITSAEDRYIMTCMAIVDNPHFKISKIEIERGGPSHTIDTLREMRHWYLPREVEFFFITGIDAVLQMPLWKEPYEIARVAHIVAASRPGYNVSQLESLPEEIKRAVIPLEIPLLAISSTEIRRRVAAGQSIRYFLPWTVEHFIYKRNLYSLEGR